ncbi:DNA helicase Rep [Oceanicoccus sagamiensis]|uniref:ATP-dependent DNA helicase Rep n=1 Tax=Oceanicoccus sagamiensis TaxID=716816 RepID=A0A1X9NDH5_9GAMM|nr:DNA helicase Rep [Oceanicoccus sagamiensis]ARN73945.1 DNA helicase Rep [Oceanicoccus sagamiensis]
MSKLNPRQQEAVKYIDGPLLVLAGAGSGKTSVITRKIAYMIEECGTKGRNIAALTFTNKAAREMKERVSQLVSGPAARGLIVSTFHNLGLRIIRKEHQCLGYKSGFSIFDAQDAQALIKDLLIQEHGEDNDQADHIQHRISNWKNDMVNPEQAIAQADGPADMLCAQAYLRYQRALKAYNALDFDDLILLPVQMFQQFPEVLQRWQRRIHYLLVDEYQDTNISQYLLVQMLIGDRGKLTVVGDDDQSIYAWRGARPENLAQLQDDYPNLKLVKLEQNYRSTARILKAANHVIDHNPHVFEKALWSELGYGDPIRVIRCRNEEAECERVVTEILDRRVRGHGQYADFAVLYRGNFQARLLELKFQVHNVPYKISGGTSFFARNEIKDIMAYLRLLINRDDDNAFLRIVNVPRRKIGASTLEGLGTYATERGISMFDACDEMGIEQSLPEASVKRLRQFSAWMNRVTQRCDSGEGMAAIREMVSDIDYEAWLHQNSSSSAVAERRMANVFTLIDSLQSTLEKADDDEDNIQAAVAKLVLRDLMDRQEEDDESMDQVQLMTLHASKGLEFPHVYVIGVEEEILPHRVSIEEDNIEEERRLCYVGITRAKQTLALTYCGKRKQYGELIDCAPSRFLDELPYDDLVWEGEEKDLELNQQRGQDTLSGLKGLFDSF